jgi:hypothetical protein
MYYLRCNVSFINNNSWEDKRVSTLCWKIRHTFKKSNREDISSDSVKIGLYKKRHERRIESEMTQLLRTQEEEREGNKYIFERNYCGF